MDVFPNLHCLSPAPQLEKAVSKPTVLKRKINVLIYLLAKPDCLGRCYTQYVATVLLQNNVWLFWDNICMVGGKAVKLRIATQKTQTELHNPTLCRKLGGRFQEEFKLVNCLFGLRSDHKQQAS